MSNLSRKYTLHTLWILVFLSIPIFTSPDFGPKMFEVSGFKRSFLGYVLLIVFFYLNYYYFIPRYYFAKRYFLFGAIAFCSYAMIAKIPGLFFQNHGFGPMPMPMHEPGRFGGPPPGMGFSFLYGGPEGGSIFQFLLVLILSIMLRITNQLRSISSEKLKAEVSYLKAQMNPHFLFNTLNSLYALTIQKSDAAPDAVLKLSNMMRYVVTESASELVPLEKEINYIRDYIDMQKLRIADLSNLSFVVSGDPKGKRIAPLVIIPFIENAFKYGINAEEDWKISIAVAVSENDLILEVRNNKVQVNLPDENGSEQGISNTQKRLEIIYPGQHELQVTDGESTFKVWLKIQLS